MRKLFLIIGVSLVFLFLTGFQSFAQCEGDFDCDGDVDGTDLAVFAADFGRTDCAPNGPAPVEKTGQTTSYATGDDGDLQMGVEWPDPRFIDNEDGTVTDNLTGLIWLKNANCFGGRYWAQAILDCNALSGGSCGLTDGSFAGEWRFPNVRELQSLIDFGEERSALPAGHPFANVQTESDNFEDGYWSSTTYAHEPIDAWNVYFDTGSVDGDWKGNRHHVWCVRGGQ